MDNATTGPLYLRQTEISSMIVEALRYHERVLGNYQLHNYVVMANHVHLLVTPRVELPKLTHSLKRFTLREANRVLALTGRPFWQRETYDRAVRD